MYIVTKLPVVMRFNMLSAKVKTLRLIGTTMRMLATKIVGFRPFWAFIAFNFLHSYALRIRNVQQTGGV